MSDIVYSGQDNLAAMRAAARYNAALIKLVSAASTGEKIIDFGAGDGMFAQALAKTLPAPHCIETDPTLRKSIAEKGLTASASLESLEDQAFDFIYSLNVLEHIEPDVDVLRALRSKLKSGGRVFIFVPAFPILFGPMDQQVGHVRRYRKSELQQKVQAAGFTTEAISYFDSLGFLAALAHKGFFRSGQISEENVRVYDRYIFPISKALDRVLSSSFGKNLHILARAT